MRFIVENEEKAGKPCPEAFRGDALKTVSCRMKYVDTRFPGWKNVGINHRIEPDPDDNGDIVYWDIEAAVWLVDLDTLEGFMDFAKKYSPVMVDESIVYKGQVVLYLEHICL